MLDAVLTGDGLAAVADLAADAAGGPVVVVVPRLGVAVASPGGEAHAGRASAATSASRAAGRVAPGAARASSPRSRSPPATSGSAASCCSTPAGPEPEAVEFLHLAAVAALTEVAVEEAREEVEENVRGSFLEELRERPDGLDAGRHRAPRRPARLRPVAAARSCCAPS